jgi:DNA-binding NarL/FixJ family response regulator
MTVLASILRRRNGPRVDASSTGRGATRRPFGYALAHALTRRVCAVGCAARAALPALLAAVLVAAGVAAYLEHRVAELLLGQVVARATDQVQLGVLQRVSLADFEPPYTRAELDDLATRLDPLLARARQEGSGVLRLNLFARDGTILYSDLAALRGRAVSPLESSLLAGALARRPGAEVGAPHGPEAAALRERYGQVLEVYVPLVLEGRVVGAYEFYQDPAPLRPLRPLVWGAVAAGLAGGFPIQVLALRAIARRSAKAPRGRPPERAAETTAAPPEPHGDEAGGAAPRPLVRVVVADDRTLARRLLVKLLAGEPDLVVVAEEDDGPAALEAVRAHRPDLVLIAAGLLGPDRLTTAELRLASPASRLVVLEASGNGSAAQSARTNAADGYVARTAAPSELLAALRATARGERVLPPPGADYGLTPRELEVLRLLATNSTYREIARELVISEETVRSHVKRVLHKLGQPDRGQAVLAATRAGLL